MIAVFITEMVILFKHVIIIVIIIIIYQETEELMLAKLLSKHRQPKLTLREKVVM